jgi:hypothetical protein
MTYSKYVSSQRPLSTIKALKRPASASRFNCRGRKEQDSLMSAAANVSNRSKSRGAANSRDIKNISCTSKNMKSAEPKKKFEKS